MAVATHKAGLFRSIRSSLTVLLVLCTFGGTVALWSVPARADLKGPEATDRQVTLVVSSLLRREHLSKHPLDDEISRRGLDNYLKNLDGMKVYFTQADVDEFMAQREKLDDMIKRGDIRHRGRGCPRTGGSTARGRTVCRRAAAAPDR